MNQITIGIVILIVIAVFGYFVWLIPYLRTQMDEDFLQEDQTQEIISGNIDVEGKRGESYIEYVDKTKNIIENITKEQEIYMNKVE
jgi:hypothetical protein